MSTVFLHFDYLTPQTINEACSLLSKYKGKARLMAGGTDLKVLMRNKALAPQYIISLSAIPDLDYIRYDEERLRIGASATLHTIESSPIIQKHFPMLADTACQMGSPQIRNMGTIGGNLGRAAPSSDMAPPLIALSAEVKIVSLKGQRVIALEEFFVGSGQTALQSDEILTEIRIPNLPAHSRGIHLKLPARRAAVDIAAVGVAVVTTLDAKGTNIVDAKIVLGTVAPTPIRANKAENIIKGKAIEGGLIEKAAQVAAEEARPTSSIRAKASYRKEMVKVLVIQAIRKAVAFTPV